MTTHLFPFALPRDTLEPHTMFNTRTDFLATTSDGEMTVSVQLTTSGDRQVIIQEASGTAAVAIIPEESWHQLIADVGMLRVPSAPRGTDPTDTLPHDKMSGQEAG